MVCEQKRSKILILYSGHTTFTVFKKWKAVDKVFFNAFFNFRHHERSAAEMRNII